MIKIMRSKKTGNPVVVEYRDGAWEKHYCNDMVEAKKTFNRLSRNAQKRAENEILRDICGTSARAAREDMGL